MARLLPLTTSGAVNKTTKRNFRRFWHLSRALALFKKAHQRASRKNAMRRHRASLHSMSAARVDTRGFQLTLDQVPCPVYNVSTGSSASRLCGRLSSTAPTDDPRPFVRALALVDAELAQRLVDNLAAVRPTQCNLLCGRTVLSSHVHLGSDAELCVAGSEACFDGWLPISLDRLILQISTGSAPAFSRA